MSVITEMVLLVGGREAEAMARVNSWCADNDSRQQRFEQLDTDASGGFKLFNSEIWAMSANHFLHSDLAAALPTFGWRRPELVVLIVNYEHDECATVYRAVPVRLPAQDVRW